MSRTFRLGGEVFDFLGIEEAPRMTWPELKHVCSITGQKLDGLDPADPAVLQAIVLVSVRRKRPEFQFSDLDDVMWEVIDTLEDSADAVDPTEAVPGTTSS